MKLNKRAYAAVNQEGIILGSPEGEFIGDTVGEVQFMLDAWGKVQSIDKNEVEIVPVKIIRDDDKEW